MQTTDRRLQIGFKMQSKYKMQTADCRMSLKRRLRPKLPHRLIREIFLMCELMVIILRVTQCRSRNLFRENFLLGLFRSKKIVAIENVCLLRG